MTEPHAPTLANIAAYQICMMLAKEEWKHLRSSPMVPHGSVEIYQQAQLYEFVKEEE